MKPGKKTKIWNRIRAKLKTEFFDKGITRCEEPGCHSDFGLSFAHRLKRRKIGYDETEMRKVALLCIPHHEKYERMESKEMFDGISKLIESRDLVQV